jgi:hypothetical protein
MRQVHTQIFFTAEFSFDRIVEPELPRLTNKSFIAFLISERLINPLPISSDNEDLKELSLLNHVSLNFFCSA